jgi:endonuclease/exonuclease/phosphatase family metal-dependent hydrolase
VDVAERWRGDEGSLMALKIGTWNVEYAAGQEKNERRLRRIHEMDCDVWILTETHDDLDLGAGHHKVSTTQRVTGRAGARWTTIWSRFPISEVVPVEDSNRTVAALLATSTGPLLVYGTVLPWHSDRGPSADAKSWVEHHRVVPMQAREWRQLQDAFPDAALCVAGDLNMNLGGPHYYGTVTGRRMLRAGLEEANLVCLTETERIPAGRLRHGPIDHICISKHLACEPVVDAWEGTDGDGVSLSDHSGLAVSLATV